MAELSPHKFRRRTTHRNWMPIVDTSRRVLMTDVVVQFEPSNNAIVSETDSEYDES